MKKIREAIDRNPALDGGLHILAFTALGTAGWLGGVQLHQTFDPDRARLAAAIAVKDDARAGHPADFVGYGIEKRDAEYFAAGAAYALEYVTDPLPIVGFCGAIGACGMAIGRISIPRLEERMAREAPPTPRGD